MENKGKQPHSKSYFAPLFAGAVAGVSVDVTLYPLDTLKTRLQSQQGFHKAGGFSGVYRGNIISSWPDLPYCFLGFSPGPRGFKGAQLRFSRYYLFQLACIIRVPTEIAKQRKQTYTGSEKRSSIRILVHAFHTDGFRNGVYRGFLSTVVRDLPFSFIELPLWELFKSLIKDRNDGQITSFQSGLSGSVAGALAAAATTPLDLAKTRIMLADDYAATRKVRIRPVLADIYLQAGLRGLFAGVAPRMTAFMVGGFVFFGVYDYSKNLFEKYFDR
nr:S-adenosylmethionine mitochondrial carrier protein homolog [Vanessa tameamea]